MELEQAIAVLRGAGYRVTKPKPRKQQRVGPTFVAEFCDGEVVRMSTNTPLTKLDWQRGTRLCQAGYEARARLRDRLADAAEAAGEPVSVRRLPSFPPPIIRGRFEQDGRVLATYERPSKWLGTGESCELREAA